jgi:hypothetical protein
MRFSVEILRRRADGSSQVMHQYNVEALSPMRVKATAERDLNAWTARGANAVAIYNHHAEKLYEWETSPPN